MVGTRSFSTACMWSGSYSEGSDFGCLERTCPVGGFKPVVNFTVAMAGHHGRKGYKLEQIWDHQPRNHPFLHHVVVRLFHFTVLSRLPHLMVGSRFHQVKTSYPSKTINHIRWSAFIFRGINHFKSYLLILPQRYYQTSTINCFCDCTRNWLVNHIPNSGYQWKDNVH